jgi:hypothetical protein
MATTAKTAPTHLDHLEMSALSCPPPTTRKLRIKMPSALSTIDESIQLVTNSAVDLGAVEAIVSHDQAKAVMTDVTPSAPNNSRRRIYHQW